MPKVISLSISEDDSSVDATTVNYSVKNGKGIISSTLISHTDFENYQGLVNAVISAQLALVSNPETDIEIGVKGLGLTYVAVL